MDRAYFYERDITNVNIALPSFDCIKTLVDGSWHFRAEFEARVVEAIKDHENKSLRKFVESYVPAKNITGIEKAEGKIIMEGMFSSDTIVESLKMARSLNTMELIFFECVYTLQSAKVKKIIYWAHENDFSFVGFDNKELYSLFSKAIGMNKPEKNVQIVIRTPQVSI